MANIDFDCPHCRYSTGEFIFVGVGGPTEIDSRFGFETDQICGVCGEEVTIQVPASLY